MKKIDLSSVSLTLLVGCFVIIVIILFSRPTCSKSTEQIELTNTDSQTLIFKAGYLLGADRQKDGFDVTSTWQQDSTLFFDKYIKK